jgi:putative phosphoesterase
MKIMAFSDLHANLKSTKDLEPLLEEVDLSIFCGDLLGYGTDINQCLEFVVDAVDLVVRGNHDRMAISGESLENQHPVVKKSLEYTRKQLNEEQIDLITSLPEEIFFKGIYITHSMGDRYLREEKDFIDFYKTLKPAVKYAFFGHTHQQAFCEIDNKIMINPGSITKGRRGFKRGYVLLDEGEIKFIKLEDIL